MKNILLIATGGTIASKDNVIGCQFHPEKSGTVGKKILLAFKEMIEC